VGVFDYQDIGDFPLAPIIPIKITSPLWSEYQGEYVSGDRIQHRILIIEMLLTNAVSNLME
jgi:hypothetical protein